MDSSVPPQGGKHTLISRDLGNPVCGQRVVLGAGVKIEWVNKPNRAIMCYDPKFSQAEQELIHIKLTKMLAKGG